MVSFIKVSNEVEKRLTIMRIELLKRGITLSNSDLIAYMLSETDILDDADVLDSDIMDQYLDALDTADDPKYTEVDHKYFGDSS